MPKKRKKIILEGQQRAINEEAVMRQKTLKLNKDQIVKSVDSELLESDKYFADIKEIKITGEDRYIKILFKPVGIKGRKFFSEYSLDIFYELDDEFE